MEKTLPTALAIHLILLAGGAFQCIINRKCADHHYHYHLKKINMKRMQTCILVSGNTVEFIKHCITYGKTLFDHLLNMP